jgi:hypothetical protein
MFAAVSVAFAERSKISCPSGKNALGMTVVLLFRVTQSKSLLAFQNTGRHDSLLER